MLIIHFLVTVWLSKAKTAPKLFTGRTLCSSLIQTQNINMQSPGMYRKQNFRTKLKVTEQSWLFLFAFSPPLSFSFSCLLFTHFILVGAVFAKAFRMLGLDERKVRWVVDDKIFMGICRSTLHGFFPLFVGSPWLNAAQSGMVWKISSPH